MNEAIKSPSDGNDSAADQRARALQELTKAGAAGVLGSDLAHATGAAVISKRISELRRAGAVITSEPCATTAGDGVTLIRTRYVLQAQPAVSTEQ